MMKKTCSGFARLLSLLLALVLITSLLPASAIAAGANSLTESLNRESWLENNAIHVDVSKKSGAIYIRNVAGAKPATGEENTDLL